MKVQEHGAVMEYQKAAVEGKQVEHQQQIMDQFPFFGDQSAGSILQLAPVLPHLHPYLQLAQPDINPDSSHPPPQEPQQQWYCYLNATMSTPIFSTSDPRPLKIITNSDN